VVRPLWQRPNLPNRVRDRKSPLTRSYHGAAVVNGRIYVIGGAGEDNKPFDESLGTGCGPADSALRDVE
jgi:hypothetical protein